MVSPYLSSKVRAWHHFSGLRVSRLRLSVTESPFPSGHPFLVADLANSSWLHEPKLSVPLPLAHTHSVLVLEEAAHFRDVDSFPRGPQIAQDLALWPTCHKSKHNAVPDRDLLWRVPLFLRLSQHVTAHVRTAHFHAPPSNNDAALTYQDWLVVESHKLFHGRANGSSPVSSRCSSLSPIHTFSYQKFLADRLVPRKEAATHTLLQNGLQGRP